MRVSVYFNLHKKLFSIRAEDGPAKGRVIAHADRVLMHHCTMVVSQAGNARVRREGRKNVHAFIRGELIYMNGDFTQSGLDMWDYHGFLPFVRGMTDMFWAALFKVKSQGISITYDPYRDTSFVSPEVSRIPIYRAATVYLGKGDGVYALGAQA